MELFKSLMLIVAQGFWDLEIFEQCP